MGMGLTLGLAFSQTAQACNTDTDCGHICEQCLGGKCTWDYGDPNPECAGGPKGTITDRPRPGEPSGKGVTVRGQTTQSGDAGSGSLGVPMPPPVYASVILAVMPTSRKITIAYDPIEGGKYKTCSVDKGQNVVIKCFASTSGEGKAKSDLYYVWQDSQSLRFEPEDGKCSLSVKLLDANNSEMIHKDPVCTADVGAKGVQMVWGSGVQYGAFTGSINDPQPADFTVGTNKAPVSTVPLDGGSGRALVIHPRLKSEANPTATQDIQVRSQTTAGSGPKAGSATAIGICYCKPGQGSPYWDTKKKQCMCTGSDEVPKPKDKP